MGNGAVYFCVGGCFPALPPQPRRGRQVLRPPLRRGPRLRRRKAGGRPYPPAGSPYPHPGQQAKDPNKNKMPGILF
jgi:hypothetical protein